MRLTTSLILLSLLLPFSAHAYMFGKLTGTYEILSCENQGATPSAQMEKLCNYKFVVIEATRTSTHITFKTDQKEQGAYILNFSSSEIRARIANYTEQGANFAAYTRDHSGLGRVFVLRHIRDDRYHLSLHRRSTPKNTFDVFEIEVKRLQN